MYAGSLRHLNGTELLLMLLVTAMLVQLQRFKIYSVKRINGQVFKEHHRETCKFMGDPHEEMFLCG